jgi:Ran GTPase-activating protein (RanGAP) involved in mRNA processing and transport
MLGDESADYLYPCLKLHENLQILKFNSLNLSLLDAKAIGKVLADFKNIKELSLENCQLNQLTTKEIADGLMRAK